VHVVLPQRLVVLMPAEHHVRALVERVRRELALVVGDDLSSPKLILTWSFRAAAPAPVAMWRTLAPLTGSPFGPTDALQREPA
jgi:hypothetical protein